MSPFSRDLMKNASRLIKSLNNLHRRKHQPLFLSVIFYKKRGRRTDLGAPLTPASTASRLFYQTSQLPLIGTSSSSIGSVDNTSFKGCKDTMLASLYICVAISDGCSEMVLIGFVIY